LKKVLYISYDGLTDPLGQSQVLPYLQYLSKHGFQFTILSFEKSARFAKEASIVQAIADAAGISWVPLFFTAKPPVLSKMWDRYRMKQKALALHKKLRFDLVHCRSYVAAETGLLLQQRFGVKMLFDMRGFWADEKVDNGQWDLEKVFFKRLYHFYKKREKEFLLHADGIVSLTQAAKDYLLQQPAYGQLAIDVIPCCADLQHFDYETVPAEAVAAKKAALHIPEGAKVLTYLGSVGGWYMTAEMFRFFYLLQQQSPEYVMLLLTKDDPEQVRKEAAETGIPSDKLFITYSDRKGLPAYLALSNASVFFIRNTFSKTASSPTKHAELMGMGIPVICNSIGDTGNIITQTKTGILVNTFDTGSLQEVLQQMNDVECLDKSYIRSCAKAIFDLQAGAETYLRLYKRMLALPATAPITL